LTLYVKTVILYLTVERTEIKSMQRKDKMKHTKKAEMVASMRQVYAKATQKIGSKKRYTRKVKHSNKVEY